MKTTFEHIPKIIREYGLECFTVSSSKTGNSYVFKSNDEKDIEANIDDLISLMRIYHGDYFIMEGRKNKNANREIFKFEFSNYAGQQPQQVAGIGNIGANVGYTEDFVQKMIQTEIGKVKCEIAEEALKKREQKLEADEREFNRRKNDAIEIGIQRIGEYFPKLFKGKQTPQQSHYSQVSGVEQPTDIQVLEGDELSDKVSDLIERWEKADPDWLTVLTKVVDFAESKKAIDLGMMQLYYENVKEMIIEKL